MAERIGFCSKVLGNSNQSTSHSIHDVLLLNFFALNWNIPKLDDLSDKRERENQKERERKMAKR